MSVYDKLKELNITLPPVAIPAAAYVPYAQTGNVLFLSGHIARRNGQADWSACSLFDGQERAILAYTDAMTRQIQVPDEVFGAISALYAPPQLVEITATIAAYNMVSRFLEALQIHSHDVR